MISRLILLLGTYVDVPPYGSVDFDVLVRDVRYHSSLSWSKNCAWRIRWILLDIDCFERMVESYILECDIFDAVKARARSDCSNCHPYSEKYLKVAYHDILRALGQLSSFVHWLYRDSVIEIGDLHALNQDVLPRGVDAVSV